MTALPEINLDDRTFQDLVSEARVRISQTCPEWTEHNVSDPGITLIELFAWMTELTIYRLNRIPDKLHVALLELIGIRLDPPSAAEVDLRFRMTGPADEPLQIPLGTTEVGTLRASGDEPIVFQTTTDFTIQPLRPAAYVLIRGSEPPKLVAIADGVARPHGTEQLAFGNPPRPGDALHLGFDHPIGRMLLRVDVEASQASGPGVAPDDPPLRWEVSAGDNDWIAANVLEDRTGGFNYGSGAVELQLPESSSVRTLAGQRLHWVRCRIDERTASGKEAKYAEPPEIYSITAAPIGALLPAAHSTRADRELLGISDGTPGQEFALRMSPVLPLQQGETLELQSPGESTWTPWERKDSFAWSGPADLHFSINYVSGQVAFGPAIRETDGSWKQYGAVPPKGAVLAFTGYRYGGGRAGNVSAGTLTMLKSSLAGVDSVVNPEAAAGGVDAETLTAARQRAPMDIRSRYRAVTVEDYEYLAGESTRRVARARCRPPLDGGAVALYLLPRVDPADRQLTAQELTPDESLFALVAEYLDERRMIGTTVQLLPVKLRGVSVVVNLQATPSADLRRVEEDVAHALYTYVNPLIGGSTSGPGTGWPFGRPLNQGELYGVVHAIEGVEFVKILRLYETDVYTGEQESKPAGSHIELAIDELLVSGKHIVKAIRREL